jgi:hypothetical protein
MLVDYERAWFRLKRVVSEKSSHGQRDLALAMANLEVECMLDNDEPPPEATAAVRPLTGADKSASAMPISANPLLAQEARNGTHKKDRNPIG